MNIGTVLKRNPIVFPLACVAAVLLLLISEGSYWQAVRTLDQLGTMEAVRTRIQSLNQSVLDAETGQRGYLLTSRAEHLELFDKARQEVAETLGFLDRYYAEEAPAQAVITQLRALTEAKLSELATTVRRRQEGKRLESAEFVLGDIGRAQMTAIRARTAELKGHEALKVAQGRSDLYRTLLLSRLGMAALGAIGLLALYLYLHQAWLLRQEQQALKDAVQLERDRLDVEVKQRTAQLTELTTHLLTAREDERNRLARNLHDELGALLTSAKLDAARIKSRLAGTAPEALERLAHLVETLNQSIALGRSIIEDLRPSTLGNLGLVATLEILAREFAEQSGVEVECELAPVKLGAAAELMVYRLLQEAITNISKYARASRVWVKLAARDGQVEMSVRDDGIGFDTRVPPSSAYGLVGMRFRVEAVGGALVVVSAPGQGTQLQVTMPESSADAQPDDA